MNNPFTSIDARLSNLENLLLDLKHQPKESHPKIELPINIGIASRITGLTKPTLYSYVQQNKISYYKKGNRLYFFESELVDWIKTGKQKTLSEIEADADSYLANNKKAV